VFVITYFDLGDDGLILSDKYRNLQPFPRPFSTFGGYHFSNI